MLYSLPVADSTFSFCYFSLKSKSWATGPTLWVSWVKSTWNYYVVCYRKCIEPVTSNWVVPQWLPHSVMSHQHVTVMSHCVTMSRDIVPWRHNVTWHHGVLEGLSEGTTGEVWPWHLFVHSITQKKGYPIASLGVLFRHPFFLSDVNITRHHLTSRCDVTLRHNFMWHRAMTSQCHMTSWCVWRSFRGHDDEGRGIIALEQLCLALKLNWTAIVHLFCMGLIECDTNWHTILHIHMALQCDTGSCLLRLYYLLLFFN